MKKKLTFIVLAILTLILITACPSPPSIMGTEPIVIGGHFLTDQIIENGGWIDKFFPDGTYEVIGQDWDDATEKWVQTYGARGTYEYDAATCVMSRTATERWDWDGSETWIVLADYYRDEEPDVTAWSLMDTYLQYYTSIGGYAVFTAGAGNVWEYTYQSTLKETSGGVERTDIYKVSRRYTITGTEINFFQENSGKGFDDTALQANYQREWGGDIYRLAPTGIEWKSGKTVTFYYTEMVNRARNWDWDAGDWGAYSDWLWNDMRSRTLTHMGDFLLETTAQSMKGFY